MTLAVEYLTVALGGSTVLRGVGAELWSGGITAICGPNGAGKSTLLAALAGLIEPVEGEARLTGTPLSALAPRERARRIGYLPQAGDVAWDLSVANLVALGLLPYADRDRHAVAQALEAVDLAPFADRPVSTLSGGEKARALLARVLAGRPEWILADEPLAALDLGHQLALLRQLRAAADRGAGVVLVLHDLALAMNHADRVLVLDRGTLAADDAPDRALSEDVIARVWRVRARWIGEAGGLALVSGLPG